MHGSIVVIATERSMKMVILQSGEQYTVLRYRSKGLWDGVILKRKGGNDMVKIYIEDKGQDILWFKVNDGGLVEKAGPFQNELWKGAYIPCQGLRIGQMLPIHHPPHIIRGFLKYRIVAIKKYYQNNHE